jgi:hypothetical protein
MQLTQLTVALEEQKMDFARQYKALQAEFTAQIECLKAEIAASISTQLSNVYVPAPVSSSSYAAVAQAPPPSGTLLPKSPPLSQPSNLASISMSRVSGMSEALYCTIDIQRLMKASAERSNQVLSGQRLRRRFVRKKGVGATGGVQQLLGIQGTTPAFGLPVGMKRSTKQ